MFMLIRAGAWSPSAGTVQHHILAAWYVGVFPVVQEEETNQETTFHKVSHMQCTVWESAAATDDLLPLGQSQQ